MEKKLSMLSMLLREWTITVNNTSDSAFSSCLDMDSIDSYDDVQDQSNGSAGSGSVGGGGDSGDMPDGDVYLPGTGGGGGGRTEWCFVDSFETIQFCWLE